MTASITVLCKIDPLQQIYFALRKKDIQRKLYRLEASAFYQNCSKQPEFESKDCHPQMKIRMISIILCDNYFCRNGSLKFYADRLNGSRECTFCIL